MRERKLGKVSVEMDIPVEDIIDMDALMEATDKYIEEFIVDRLKKAKDKCKIKATLNFNLEIEHVGTFSDTLPVLCKPIPKNKPKDYISVDLGNTITKEQKQQIELQQSLSEQMIDDKIKIPVPNKPFYSKELIQISGLKFGYGTEMIFDNFDFSMYGGQRIRIIGKNGSGKSTLLKLICGDLKPKSGTIKAFGKIAYLNQDLSVLDKNKNIVENIMDIAGVLKHDAHVIAANFGFRGDASNKRVGVLSGGELLKATLAAVLGGTEQPDLLILDEPTNNLEIKSIAILEDALNQYRGAILLVSHDEMFVKNIKTDIEVNL